MSKKPQSYKKAEVSGPPEGQAFVWETAEFLSSPACRAASLYCRRLLDFLKVEHLLHGGLENGRLQAPYSQLVEWGIPRRAISETIKEAEALGLIAVERGGKRNQVENSENRYRITWLEFSVRTAAQPYWSRGGNEWQRVTDAQAEAVKTNLKDSMKAARDGRKVGEKKSASRFPRGNHLGSPVGNASVPTGEPRKSQIQQFQWGGLGSPVGTASKILAPTANTNIPEQQQGDIERYLAQHRPIDPDDLRRDLKDHLENAPRGSMSRIAEAAGTTPARLSHFKSGGGLAEKTATALRRALLEAKAA